MKASIYLQEKRIYIAVGIASAIMVIGIGIFLFRLLAPLRHDVGNGSDRIKQELEIRQEVEGYIRHIGSVIPLPSGMPTVATVVDAEKLKAQPFFAQAMDGDKVLIYTETKRAILYRPSTGKVIDMTFFSEIPTFSPTLTPTSVAPL